MSLHRTRLTAVEEGAILTALASVLADEGLQGFEDDPELERQVLAAMRSAQKKLWQRQVSRETTQRIREAKR